VRLFAIAFLVASSFALRASATPSQGAALRSNAVQKFCASRIRGDFDGDGRTDSAVAFSSRSICDAMDGRSWYLVVRLSRGGHLRRPLGHDLAASSEGRIGCEPLCFVRAAPDFNRDGRDEIEVSLQQGAAMEQRGVYGVVGNRIRRSGSRPAGQPLTFSYGGSLRYGAGVVCRTQRGRHLVVAAEYGYSSEYGRHRMPVTEHVYLFEGRTFVHLRDQKRVYRGSAALPPRVPGGRC